MIRVLVTSGGTREYIDDVRVLTNISTGKLGAMIIESFMDSNYGEIDYEAENPRGNMLKAPRNPMFEVFHIHSSTATKPEGKCVEWEPNFQWPMGYSCNDILYHSIVKNSAQEVYDAMKEHVPRVDVVIHSMAVSDFTFNRENPVKLKSNDPEGFCDYLKANIKMNPKIIKMVKEWNPEVYLIGFKFEVGLSYQELIDVAQAARKSYHGDFVLANDKQLMTEAKRHCAWLCSDYEIIEAYDKKDIANKIFLAVKRRLLAKEFDKAVKNGMNEIHD